MQTTGTKVRVPVLPPGNIVDEPIIGRIDIRTKIEFGQPVEGTKDRRPDTFWIELEWKY